MGFMKTITIFDNGRTKVRINQCYAKGRKTYLYAVRKDDHTGLAEYIGGISFDGRWRQYVFIPESDTKWSAGCQQGITDFLNKINVKWRRKIIYRNHFCGGKRVWKGVCAECKRGK